MKSVRTMALLTVLGMVGVVALGYFLLIAPKRSEVKELNAKRVSQETANSKLKAKIDTLSKQAKSLPAIQAELAKYAKQLPDNPALPTLIRTLTAAADEAGVQIVTVAPSKPSEVTTAPKVAAKPKTTDTKSSTSTKAKTTTTRTTTTTAATSGERLFAIPLTIQVRGGYFEVESFLSALEALQRSTLVGQLALLPASDSAIESFGGNENDLDATISARVFMIQKAAATTATATTTAAK